MNFEKIVKFSKLLDGKGGSTPLPIPEAKSAFCDLRLSWVHLDATDPDTTVFLRDHISCVDDIVIAALLADETRPRCIEVQSGIFMILRGINMNPHKNPEDMVSLRMFIDDHRVISVEKNSVMTVRQIAESLDKGQGPKNTSEFLLFIVTHMFDHIENFVSQQHEALDKIEDTLRNDKCVNGMQNVNDLKRSTLTLRRYLAPQKDVLNHLKSEEKPWIDIKHRRLLAEEQDRLIRMDEDLALLHARAMILTSEVENTTSQKSNRGIYFISIMSSIFLPLTFLTGLMGANIGGIPGNMNPNAFWELLALCLFVGFLQTIIFRWLRFF